jgi:hypothetical protein
LVSNPHLKKKKNLVNKIQGWEPILQKYKANENTSRHNPKKKKQINNQQKSGKNHMQRPYAKRTHGNDNQQ